MAPLRATVFILCILSVSLKGDIYTFDTPSDDRWHYPFNFTPGVRATGSTFGAAGIPMFNDRDAVVIVAWDTSSQLDPNLDSEQFLIHSVTVIATNQTSQFVVPGWEPDLSMDEWYVHDVNNDELLNDDGFPRGEINDTDGESNDPDPNARPIELFGVGFGPTYTAETWSETSLYIGSNGNSDAPRDPYPLAFKDFTGESLHVEDSVKGLHNNTVGILQFSPAPWAVGDVSDYVPGVTQDPFEVRFDIDLDRSDDRVRHYFQEQLTAGKVFVAITSMLEAAQQGAQNGFPSFFMKEGLALHTQAKAIRLEMDVSLDVLPKQCGDFNTAFDSSDISGPQGTPDCYVNLFDLAELTSKWLSCTDPANAACND